VGRLCYFLLLDWGFEYYIGRFLDLMILGVFFEFFVKFVFFGFIYDDVLLFFGEIDVILSEVDISMCLICGIILCMLLIFSVMDIVIELWMVIVMVC